MKLVAAPPRTFSTQRAFHDHAPDLYRYAYWLSTNAEDARDLVQDAFVGLVNRQQRSDQTPVGDVRAYLFTSVRNAFYQSLRRGSSTETYSDDALEADSDDTIDRLPEQALLLDEQRRSVRQAVERLTPRHRRVLALREVEGLSYAEMGELVGMSPNAVAQLLLRARLRLRYELRVGATDPSSLPDECRGLLPDLCAFADGEITADRRSIVQQHLGSCAL